MRKKISLMLPLLCAPLAFWACGDGESSSGASANGSVSESDLVVATFDDLPVCSDKREGATAYVKDEKTAYICEDGKWISDDETDGDDSSSSVKPGSSSSSVKPGSSSSKKDDPMSSSSIVSSSSSAVKVESSSSSRGLFDMTKDEFLNPKVSYGEMTDTRDNKTYKTVKIDDQVWMAENLNYADSTKMPSLKGKSWCYDNKAENCDVTGRLYIWAAAIDSVALANDADNPQICGYGVECTLPTVVQGVCPEGWHLPTYEEWETLFTAVGGSSKAGTALKSQTGWKSQTGDAADRDAYGFSALPAGYRHYRDGFGRAGDYAYFWSTRETNIGGAYYMVLYYDYEYAALKGTYKDDGFSVRCLQDSN
ncbi:MAG: fibrobacter succinogenes major paralogous domain-containing protein [Fibrobacter sp.]|nr:fibrobacter succinogenes major paralogous domain-containing protein [Fibrobacter sp.]